MEEIIARRHIIKEKACLVFIFVGVMGLVLGAFFVVVKELNLSSVPEDRQWALILLACIEFFAGTFGIIWGIISLKKAKTPPELIVLSGRRLKFVGGYCCDIKDIVNATCKVSKYDPSGLGTLQIVLKEGVIKYKQVENAAQACQRLTELMQQSR
ncbi:MAG: hypothetical protein J1G05_04195 [Clostridiales bacterium]|nr:hypothetical protein [Clostridiales bacterium]